MGVFVPVSPFPDLNLGGMGQLTGVHQLFLLGGIAISVGVFTYSRRVMETVGSGIFRLSPVTALVVVLSTGVVMFLFASEGLKAWLETMGLPSPALVPVSSSQAVVGGILGIGLVKGGRNIHFGVIGKIGGGWILTPIVSGLISWVLLFFMQNVFMQTVCR